MEDYLYMKYHVISFFFLINFKSKFSKLAIFIHFTHIYLSFFLPFLTFSIFCLFVCLFVCLFHLYILFLFSFFSNFFCYFCFCSHNISIGILILRPSSGIFRCKNCVSFFFYNANQIMIAKRAFKMF